MAGTEQNRNRSRTGTSWKLGLVWMAGLVVMVERIEAQCPYELVTAGDATAGDSLGWSSAVSGDTAVFGALTGPGNGSSDGAVYVFVWSGSAWVQEAKLTADDAGGGVLEFGRAVGVDGDTIVVGAKTGSGGGRGAAYVFERTGTVWTKTGKLEPDPMFSAGTADFGAAVGVDGNTIVAGAPGDHVYAGMTVTVSSCGTAYVFSKSGATWTNMTGATKLSASDAAFNDRFGGSVGVDGTRIAVGARTNGPGAAYVFDSTGGWASMNETAILTASDGAAGDTFGHSIAVSGETVIVGAPLDDTAAGADKGSAYVFAKTAGVWGQQQKLVSSNTQVSAGSFGEAVGVAGERAAVAERYVQHLHVAVVITGVVFVYERTGTVWAGAEMIPVDTTAFTGPVQARSMGFDGTSVAVGSPLHDWEAMDAGSGFVYRGADADCNGNGVPDGCDIYQGTSADVDLDGVPDECVAKNGPGDVDGDGMVDIDDLTAVILGWGVCAGCAADLDGDGEVEIDDLTEVILNWT